MDMRIEKEVRSLSEGLNKLLTKYGVNPPPYSLEGRMLTIGGEKLPLFPWRNEPRFQEMKKLRLNGVLGNICTIRAMRTAVKSETLREVLYREIDLCLWFADRKLVNVFAVVNGSCANVIMRFDGNADVILEAAATLPEGSEAVERHEIFTDHGVTLDQAIDTLLKQQSLYKFVEGQPAQAITDTDFELYGLNPTEVALTRTVYGALCSQPDFAKAQAEDAYVRKVVDAVFASAETQTVISLEEGEA